MPTRNIYDVVHHVMTKLMTGEHRVDTTVVGVGLTYDKAEACKAQHESINKLGFYDIAFVGRAWYEPEDKGAAASFEPHVPLGLGR